jgi:hypothetical protein
MMDENRQAEALRRRLDQELAGVHATAEARERLDSQIAPRTIGRRPRWELRRLPGALALPLAAASVVAAVVAVPTLLRTDDSATTAPPAAGPVSGPPAAPAPAPTATPSRPRSQKPVPTVPGPEEPSGTKPSATGKVTNKPEQSRTGSRLSLRADPAPALVDSRTALVLSGVGLGAADITVTWGDRSRSTKISGTCRTGRQPAGPVTSTTDRTIPHTYTEAGQYVIKVVSDDCRTERRASLKITVTEVPSDRLSSGR